MKITKEYLKSLIKEQIEQIEEVKNTDTITVTNSDGKLIVKFNGKEFTQESKELNNFKIAYTQLAMIGRRMQE